MPRFLFEDQTGRVAKIRLAQGTMPGSIAITTDDKRVFRSDLILITGFSTTQKTNTQFQPTLGQAIYLYNFGDKPTSITVSGMALPGLACTGNQRDAGIDMILDYYARNKVSRVRQSSSTTVPSVKMRIGGLPLEGLLIGCSTNTADPKTGITNFTLQLQSLELKFR